MLQKMFCYTTGPIDDFTGTHSRSSVERELGEGTDEAKRLCSEFDRLEGTCLAAFRQMGWDGDFTQRPSFFQLPDPDGCCFRWGFVIKQESDGLCFIASPFVLSHLENDPSTRRLDAFVEL